VQRRWRVIFVVAVSLLLAPLLGAGTALADPPSTPAPGSVLVTPPAQVTLVLGPESRGASGLDILVTDAAGIRRDTGLPSLRGPVASVGLAPGLAPGSYTVDWRLRDAAGTPTAGTFLFTLAPAAPSTDQALTLAGSPGEGVRPVFWLAGGLLVAVAGAGCLSVAGTRRR